MSKPISIFIVDDHNIVREGFKSIILEYSPQFLFIGEASNGKEVLSMLSNMSLIPDIILMDINMPELNGIECTKTLSKEYPQIKVLALTMVKQSGHIKNMLQAGAMGYILKDCDKEELTKAIDIVYKGGSYFSPAVSHEVMMAMTRIKSEQSEEAKGLTKRELEILDLIVKDLSNHEIAERLHISPRTVDTHKQNLLGKTHTNSVAGLVVFAIKNNLIEL
ncbi:response regulator transcription factor [Fulvivirga sp. RKSG066]|uniref:response regulator n=1 Tax=Fulvivirga aurantia TaxID=2529383 RepID=UPI0012BD3470|nr:response regulator transcription factor [Fulvivirga aurantia]MTI21563.1 response regulator transcription factor [Fulvivirga aurantia]